MADFYEVWNMQETFDRNGKGWILIEYETYNHFWQKCFVESDCEARRIINGLKKLSHVTNVREPAGALSGKGAHYGKL